MSEQLQFYIVDSFTRTRYQGNPAGVVISPTPLVEERMKQIAGELHLETAFLWPAGRAALAGSAARRQYVICYYTHVARIPLCGHDTIAAGVVLTHRGELSLPFEGDRTPGPSRLAFVSDVGELSIEVNADGAIGMRQSLPKYGDACDVLDIADALGLRSDALLKVPSRVVSTGTPFLFIGVDTPRTVDRLLPDMPALTRALNRLEMRDLAGVYVWADDRLGLTQSIYGRCFAPVAGLPEDPVTGSASGALAAHLFDAGMLRGAADGVATMQTTQGRAMGRVGNAYVTLIVSGGHVNSVCVAGHAVIVAEGTLLA